MGLKKFNAKKEIKKLKRRNSKLKKMGIIGILIGTIFIISSYALYSYTGSSLAFNSKVSKRIKTEIEVINGETEEKIKEGDYKEEQTFKIKPLSEEYEYNSTICTDNAEGRYDETTNTLTISNATNINTECTINFDCKLKTGETKTILGKDYDVLASCNQDFSKGFPNSETSEEETKKLSGLYKAEDDQGESYYFRGAVENNYVKFADMLWRIVRINGDGTIRLILNESIENSPFNQYSRESKYAGYTYDNKLSCTQTHLCEVTYDSSSNSFNNDKFGGTNSDIKTTLETWYKNNLNSVNDKIANGYFCNDTSYGSGNEDVTTASGSGDLYYGAYERVIQSKPSLKCPDPNNQNGEPRDYGGIYKTKIGLLTVDEVNMTGSSWYPYNPHADKTNYLYHDYLWTNLSPIEFNYYAYVFESSYGNFGKAHVVNKNAAVPVINLSANILISTGDGSEETPFVIK